MKGVEPRDRRTGRVKETWKKKIVESDLNRTNLSATDALDALDCKKWRILIRVAPDIISGPGRNPAVFFQIRPRPDMTTGFEAGFIKSN